MKKTFAVWEDACAEEGSVIIEAVTAKGAKRRYRKVTDERVPRPELSELTAVEMSADDMAQRLFLNGGEG